ncbi:hypothetical protein GGF41_003259 [Coemansia sp. RSA 2531]|nr:hypothetical protein GGF41_003259 [Coemansia sp. RSA 2531]
MSDSENPKQLLSESTKFRILCVMFRHFSLEYNNIATLANPTSESFQQLLGNTIAYQPKLRNAGNLLASTLESFVSNQNSRIFCALSDLYEWHRSGMRYNILQLTLKHIHSIFKRPPYELRPYTRELTYAQRLVMIYHMCNPESWSLLVEAYTALYERQFQREWEDKAKFSYIAGSPLAIPADICKTIHECTLASYALQPLAPLPSVDLSNNSLTHDDSNPAALGIKSGKIVKRRAMSAASKTKSAQMAIRAAIAKPRSVSFANLATQAYLPPAAITTDHSAVSTDSASDFWLGAANLYPSSVDSTNIPGLYQFGTSNIDSLPRLPLSGTFSEDATALVDISQQLLQQQTQYPYQQENLVEFSQDDFLSALGIGPLTSAVYHVSLATSPVLLAQASGSGVPVTGAYDSQIATSKTGTASGYNTSVGSSYFQGDEK